MHAAIIPAKAQVMLAVNPTQHIRQRNGLRQQKARLLFIQPGDVAQGHIGQTVVQRTRIQRRTVRPQDPGLAGHVRSIGKKISRLAGAAIPPRVENVSYFVIAHRVTGLHRVRVRRVLPA